ncbi:hypothetical protein [Methanocaldococcus fervens]|uniref:Uncharacterized protein n=1 Tax=Methanocaldococcus fervens (strain DSM 4213 / JCM 15782 / AG86) TaxID=573064 RepID=C7P5U6_METFA|nr:hypothetical protein [Methanocaldococcus fervens]ACV23928.1 hypothetical protein Mefer_0086 [Methanocaldococcus fervens AG86]
MVEMNKKGQFFIIGGVILAIGLILFFLLSFNVDSFDNSYLLVFKMKDAKNSIEKCLINSLISNSNLTKNLIYLKNNYKEEGIEIDYKKIKLSTIKYKAKNLTFNFSLKNNILYYNISNHGFGGAFNGTLKLDGNSVPLYVEENISVNGSIDINKNYAKVSVYDEFENLLINKTIYNNSVYAKTLYHYILNTSKEGNFAVFILAKDNFNCSSGNVSFINTSGYSNNNETYINISINGSFFGYLHVISFDKNYTCIVNESKNYIFKTTPPVCVKLLNNYSDVIFSYNLNESITNFTDTSYLIINESCKNNYSNVIYGDAPMLYVALHYDNSHIITIYSPQKGISSKGFVLADIFIIKPNLFYSSLNNSFEYQSWNIN